MATPLLRVDDVTRRFHDARGAPVDALRGVSLRVESGEIVGLVGASGSGKSTLAQLVVGLQRPDTGAILVNGIDAANATGTALAELRRAVQIVFQDPYLSLNPRLTVETTIAEPLLCNGLLGRSRRGRGKERANRVRALLEGVGLPPDTARRRPGELSGGGRQRVAIARALALAPKLLVLDEPISSLDPSIGAQVMELLGELRARDGLAYLLISHDLATVQGVADRVAVMDDGRIVETADARTIFTRPQSPAAQAMVAAAQTLSPPPWAWPGSTAQA